MVHGHVGRGVGSGLVLSLMGVVLAVGPSVRPAHASSSDCPVFTMVAAGSAFSLALASDGSVWAWGLNNYGQLGDGTTLWRSEAAPVPGLTGVTAIAAGSYHALAVVGGVVKAWGYNAYGQLGDGTTTDRHTPVAVSGLGSGVTAVSAGRYHSLAVVSGAVKAWGSNYGGDLGDGTTTDRSTPVAVSGLGSGATAVAAGDGSFSLAVVSGAVKAWGTNGVGQLGDGTTTDRHTPVAVSGLGSGATAVAAGYSHALAVVSGAVKAWGYNYQGALGDGTTTDSSTPVAVSGLGSGATAVAAGAGGHSLAVVSGAVKAWGTNNYGQLGDGTTTSSSTPVAVSGLGSGATTVAAGTWHSLAVVSGAVKAWGWNYYGLGEGTTSSSTPVAVSCLAGPSITSVSDTPDPSVAGTAVTFSAVWADAHSGVARAVICRTNAVSASSCPGGAWAIGSGSSSGLSTASFQTTDAEVGTQTYYAFVCDTGDLCSAPIEGTFTVIPAVSTSTYPSDGCAAGTNFASGWIGDVYSSVRTLTVGSTMSVCAVVEAGGVHAGGALTVSVPTPVLPTTDDDQPACADPANTGDYYLIRDVSVLGHQFKIDAKVRPGGTLTPGEVWVCVLADTIPVRLILQGGSISVPAFNPDPPGAHSPPYPITPPLPGRPSSACQQTGGEGGRLLNETVADTPAWVYTWQESPTRANVCVRVGAAGGTGGRLTLDATGGVTLVTSDTSSDLSPCPQQVIDDAGPPPYSIYLSNPGDTPAWACVKIDTVYLRIKLDSAGGQGIATFTPDPN